MFSLLGKIRVVALLLAENPSGPSGKKTPKISQVLSLLLPQNNNFHVLANSNFMFNYVIFVLPVILSVLNITDIQYLQNVIFSFEMS